MAIVLDEWYCASMASEIGRLGESLPISKPNEQLFCAVFARSLSGTGGAECTENREPELTQSLNADALCVGSVSSNCNGGTSVETRMSSAGGTDTEVVLATPTEPVAENVPAGPLERCTDPRESCK